MWRKRKQVKVREVVPAFLAVCPSIASAWQEHLKSWHGERDRGHYNDLAVVAHHLVDSFERGNLAEFPAAFALLERCLTEGDKDTKELAAIGLIEDIQNIASHRSFRSSVFYEWLGPKSRAAWDELCVFWQRVADAKATGQLGPPADHASSPPPDPRQVQDPQLRRLVEQMYRKGDNV